MNRILGLIVGMLALVMSPAFACDQLSYGVSFCSQDAKMTYLEDMPNGGGKVYAGVSKRTEHITGTVNVIARPDQGAETQAQLFERLKSGYVGDSKVLIDDEIQFPGGYMSRVMWQQQKEGVTEVVSASVFLTETYFVLAVSSEPSNQMTSHHLAFHQNMVHALRVPDRAAKAPEQSVPANDDLMADCQPLPAGFAICPPPNHTLENIAQVGTGDGFFYQINGVSMIARAIELPEGYVMTQAQSQINNDTSITQQAGITRDELEFLHDGPMALGKDGQQASVSVYYRPGYDRSENAIQSHASFVKPGFLLFLMAESAGVDTTVETHMFAMRESLAAVAMSATSLEQTDAHDGCVALRQGYALCATETFSFQVLDQNDGTVDLMIDGIKVRLTVSDSASFLTLQDAREVALEAESKYVFWELGRDVKALPVVARQWLEYEGQPPGYISVVSDTRGDGLVHSTIARKASDHVLILSGENVGDSLSDTHTNVLGRVLSEIQVSK